MCRVSNTKSVLDFMQANAQYQKTPFKTSHLDKLAQLDIKKIKRDSINVFENLELSSLRKILTKKTLEDYKKKASSKWLTNKILQPLSFLPSPLHNQYVNAAKCGNVVQLDNGEEKIFRCKTRFCVECNRIRTGKLINKYLPAVEQWTNKKFVTLTVPNVSAIELNNKLDQMQDVLSKCARAWKRKRKSGGVNLCSMEDFHGSLKIIKKIEITYKYGADSYHPHIHILTDGTEQAEFILDYWLNAFKDAKIEAQDVRDADDASVKELFKYFTKFWKFDYKERKIELYAPSVLDVIFRALKGRRVIQPSGFKAVDYSQNDNYGDDEIYYFQKKAADELSEKFNGLDFSAGGLKKLLLNDGYYVWNYRVSDWVDKSTGELLSGYNAPETVSGWFIQNFNDADCYHLQGYNAESNHLNLIKEFDYREKVNTEIRINESEWIRDFSKARKTIDEIKREYLNKNKGEYFDKIIKYSERKKQLENERATIEQIERAKAEQENKKHKRKRGADGTNFAGLFE